MYNALYYKVGIGLASMLTVSIGGLLIGILFGVLSSLITKRTAHVRGQFYCNMLTTDLANMFRPFMSGCYVVEGLPFIVYKHISLAQFNHYFETQSCKPCLICRGAIQSFVIGIMMAHVETNLIQRCN